MNVRNCRRCKRLFNYAMGPIYCTQCKQELEEQFQFVKKYVQEHPGSDIRMVSEACEVDPMQIRQWVREERLCFSDDAPSGINCDRCGVMIRTGRFCDRCKADMTTTFKNAIRPSSATQQQIQTGSGINPKMRFLDSE